MTLIDKPTPAQEPVATIEHTVGGSLSYAPIASAAYRLPMGVEFLLYTEPQLAASTCSAMTDVTPAIVKAEVQGQGSEQALLASQEKEIAALRASLAEAERLYTTYGLTATGPGCGKWVCGARDLLAKR